MKKSFFVCIIIVSPLFYLTGCAPSTSQGPTLPWDSAGPSNPTLPVEETLTEAPPTEKSPDELDVIVDVVFDNCNCSGNFQSATAIVTINNGEAPFTVNDRGPVTPINKLVTFPVPVGSSFPLTIASYDGLSWEAEKEIDASPPYSCQPPTSCNSGGNNSNNTCHEREVEVCKLVEVKKEVCTDRDAKSGNCKKWKEIVTYEEVCTTTVEMVCD